jgi:hypothetical protein
MDEDLGFGGMPECTNKEREAKILAAGRKLSVKEKVKKEKAMKRQARAARWASCHCDCCGRYMRPQQRENHEKYYPDSPFMTCHTCIYGAYR